MKIGVLTIHAAYNLGAMLQSYATVAMMQKLGAEPEIIDYYPRQLEIENRGLNWSLSPRSMLRHVVYRLNPAIQRRIANFERFRAKLKLSRRYFGREELYGAPFHYDRFVVGSDQVWNMESGCDSFYFGDFIPAGIPKYSYASSFGTESIDEAAAAQLPGLLRDFSAISVREDSAVEIVRKFAGKEAAQVLDPTLLLTADEWRALTPEADTRRYRWKKNGFILTMSVPETPVAAEVCRQLREKFQLPVVALGSGVLNFNYADRTLHDVGPREMLWLFDNAAAVCSGSFHGTAFAVNFDKPLWVLPLANRRNTRMESLLRQLALSDRILDQRHPVLSDDHPDYSEKLAEARKVSERFMAGICGVER